MANLCSNLNWATAPNAVNTLRDEEQVLRNLGKDTEILYDLVDLEKIFKVTKRTLFNWRAKNILPLIDVGGKLYMSRERLLAFISEKEGGVR